LRLTLLGSGSSGNVAFVEAGPVGARTRVLVDAGLPKAEIRKRLGRLSDDAGVPLDLAVIDGVLVTHDHNDHAGCAGNLGRPIWATAGTRRACSLDAHLVRSGDRFRVGCLEVLPVLLPHDAVETVGYVISDGKTRIGVLTDCGHDAPEVAEGFTGCDVLVLETNHDVNLLRWGPYPFSLKRRVGGQRGHLSNEQAASLLRRMSVHAPLPRVVIAAHLSLANNRPMLARRALERVLAGRGKVVIATQENGTLPGRNEQLSFNFSVSA
jgi:phosphoribosyl 1,2-cyclic phosphodiesterase